MNHVQIYICASVALSVVICVLAVAGVDWEFLALPSGVCVGLFLAALYAAVVDA